MSFESANIVFFILTMLMYIFMYMGGVIMSKSRNNRQYWRASVLPILAFTMNMGLRWGRGIDYNNGYYEYERIIQQYGKGIDVEPLWKLFHQVFGGLLSFPWQGYVALMSFILIFAAVFYLRKHKTVLPLALPIFADIVFPSENLIRWYCAFSFFLMGLYFLENKNWKKYVVFAIIAFFIHYGSVFFTVPIFFLSFLKKPLLHPFISIPVFLAFFFFFKTTDMLMFAGPLNSLMLGGNLAHYQENTEEWLTNGMGDYSATLTGSALIITPILLYIGYYLIKNRKELVTTYNYMLIGVVLMPALIQIQLAYRICAAYYTFQFLIMAYILYDTFKYKIIRKGWMQLLVILMLLVYVRGVVVTPFVKPADQTYYIWNANGRKTL